MDRASELLRHIPRARFPEMAAAAASGGSVSAVLRRMLADAAAARSGPLRSGLESTLRNIAAAAERMICAEIVRERLAEGLEREDFSFRVDTHRLSNTDLWTGPFTLGGLHPSDRGPDRNSARRMLDGRLATAALAVASREAFDRDSVRRRESYRERWRLLASGERDAFRRWEAALRPLTDDFYLNGIVADRSRSEAKAAALAASQILRGRASAAVSGFPSAAVHDLGDAALRSARGPVMRMTAARLSAVSRHRQRRPAADADRQAAIRRADAWRRRLQTPKDGADGVLGQAALAAAYGTGHEASGELVLLSRPDDHEEDGDARLLIDGVLPLRLPWRRLRALLVLSIRAAHDRLEGWANDPRNEASFRDRCRSLADAALAGGQRSDRQSFARLIGLERLQPARAEAGEGDRVYEATPSGRRFPAILACAGAHGRALQCRALADEAGRLVGYWVFDAWSDEMRGGGRRAFYGLDGRRQGYLEGRPDSFRLRIGDLHGGFVSAPERIPLPPAHVFEG